jgi:hypothetical protein
VELQRWLKELSKKSTLINQSMQILFINQDLAQMILINRDDSYGLSCREIIRSHRA